MTMRSQVFIRFRELARGKEEGFTIIEVLMAFTLLALVTVGTVPLFVAGLKSSLVSKLDTGGKNLSQERFELMRNVPFHVDANTSLVPDPSKCTNPGRTDPKNGSGTVECDFRDMMDTYYRSLTAATSTATGGYIAPGAARTADEPQLPPAGCPNAAVLSAFYRFVINPLPGFSGRYSQVVATQFLDVNRCPITPPAGYNTQIPGVDFPATRLVGVTVITTWQAGSLSKKFVAFTQIAEGRPAPPALTTQARATALKITSDVSGSLFIMEAGISSSDGSLSNGANAATKVQGSYAETTPGTRADGKSASASAPPNQTVTDGDGSPYSLIDGGGESSPSCTTANCVAFSVGGQTKNVNASIAGEQPKVASSSSQSTGQVKKNSSVGTLNLGYRNKPDAASMPSLDVTRMLVRVDEAGGSALTAVGSTYLDAASGSGHYAEAGAKSSSQRVKIIPTSFAPDGVVQVTLDSSSLSCRTTGSSATVNVDFEGEVRYLRYNATTNQNDYVSVTIEDAQAFSPLTNALLTGTQISLNPGLSPANLVQLSSYIANWGSLVNPTTTISSPPTSVNSTLNGIVSITTAPTRIAVPGSAVGISVGILSCVATDNRT